MYKYLSFYFVLKVMFVLMVITIGVGVSAHLYLRSKLIVALEPIQEDVLKFDPPLLNSIKELKKDNAFYYLSRLNNTRDILSKQEAQLLTDYSRKGDFFHATPEMDAIESKLATGLDLIRSAGACSHGITFVPQNQVQNLNGVGAFISYISICHYSIFKNVKKAPEDAVRAYQQYLKVAGFESKYSLPVGMGSPPRIVPELLKQDLLPYHLKIRLANILMDTVEKIGSYADPYRYDYVQFVEPYIHGIIQAKPFKSESQQLAYLVNYFEQYFQYYLYGLEHYPEPLACERSIDADFFRWKVLNNDSVNDWPLYLKAMCLIDGELRYNLRTQVFFRVYFDLATPKYKTEYGEINFWINASAVQLAISAYRADHGHIPLSIDDLVPNYLKKPPMDPITHNRSPLRYNAKNDNGWTLSTETVNTRHFAIDLNGQPGVETRKLQYKEHFITPDNAEVVDEQKESLVKELYDLGRRYQDEGNNEKAEAHYRKALTGLKDLGNASTQLKTEHLTKIGYFLYDRENYVLSLEVFRYIIKKLEESNDYIMDIELKDPLVWAAHSLYELAQYDKAEALYQRALCIIESRYGPENHLAASLLDDIGHTYIERSDMGSAESFCSRAVSISKKKEAGVKPLKLALYLESLAYVHKKQGNALEARDYFRQSLNIREKYLDPTHKDVTYCQRMIAKLDRSIAQKRYLQTRQAIRIGLASIISLTILCWISASICVRRKKSAHPPIVYPLLPFLVIVRYRSGESRKDNGLYLTHLTGVRRIFPVSR